MSKSKSEHTCRNCRFWNFANSRKTDKIAQCCRHAPTPSVVPSDNDTFTRLYTNWSNTNSYDWCGEWQPVNAIASNSRTEVPYGSSATSSVITPQQWNDLQLWLCGAGILDVLGGSEGDKYQPMLREPDVVTNWWSGALELCESDEEAINKAAKAVAWRKPLPNLTPAQRGRLALRMRLASRIARAMSSRHQDPAKGWLTDYLSNMAEGEALEWLLTKGWDYWSEVMDETLLWADSVDHPEPFIRIGKPKFARASKTPKNRPARPT